MLEVGARVPQQRHWHTGECEPEGRGMGVLRAPSAWEAGCRRGARGALGKDTRFASCLPGGRPQAGGQAPAGTMGTSGLACEATAGFLGQCLPQEPGRRREHHVLGETGGRWQRRRGFTRCFGLCPEPSAEAPPGVSVAAGLVYSASRLLPPSRAHVNATQAGPRRPVHAGPRAGETAWTAPEVRRSAVPQPRDSRHLSHVAE